ncbi:MAG: molybdopterin-binding protein [Candidatus Bathyarchaeota archaeon]
MNQTVEIICIGNELLIGKTLNTNAQYLAKKITHLGLLVSRIIVVGDKLNEISDVIIEAINRKPAFIITTGGLGPTFDDMTLEGIAIALGTSLKINPSNKINFLEKSIEFKGIMESSVAPLIDKVMKNNPRVYIKSHPRGTENVPFIEFHLSTKAQTINEAEKDLKKALIELTDFIKKNGGKIINQNIET